MTETAESVEAMIQEVMTPEAAPAATQEGDISEATQQEATTEETSQVTDSDGYTIKYKGKEIGLEDDKYRDFAQKGYDYEQKMHQFRVDSKLKEQEHEKKSSALKELEQINEYAKSNPAFEQLIQREWAKVQSGQEVEVAPQDRIQVLESRLNQVLSTLGSQQEEMEARKVAEMEATQEGSIAKYKETNADFDWVKKDETGHTLEDRIGQAMIDNGVKNFKIMADSFLLNEHMNRKTLEGKESLAKDIQKVNKLGLGKVTKKSQLGVSKSDDISKKSYDDLIKESFAELGLTY